MKLNFLMFSIICGATIINIPTYAVTKCVALNSSTTCTNSSGKGANWSVTCNSLPVQGVAFCGDQNGVSLGATSDNITTIATSNANLYCWCKMTSPAVSRWVFVGSTGGSDYCANTCAAQCANFARSNAIFRSALFSNLSD